MLGDSVVAGVGVQTHFDSICGETAAALTKLIHIQKQQNKNNSTNDMPTHIEWQAIGKLGYCASQIEQELLSYIKCPRSLFHNQLQAIPAHTIPTSITSSTSSIPTFVVIVVGVNHVTSLHSAQYFTQELLSLIHAINSKFEQVHHPVHIIVSAIPPMGSFVHIPQPLRMVNITKLTTHVLSLFVWNIIMFLQCCVLYLCCFLRFVFLFYLFIYC